MENQNLTIEQFNELSRKQQKEFLGELGDEKKEYRTSLYEEYIKPKFDFRHRPSEMKGLKLTYENSMGCDLPVDQKIIRKDIFNNPILPSHILRPKGEVHTLEEVRQYMKDNCSSFYIKNNLIHMTRRDMFTDIIENVSLEELEGVIHDICDPETQKISKDELNCKYYSKAEWGTNFYIGDYTVMVCFPEDHVFI